MIFNKKGFACMFEILEIVSKRKARYSAMFKECKVSHVTLQRNLKYLVEKELIKKHEGYRITEKGKLFFKKLKELKGLVSS